MRKFFVFFISIIFCIFYVIHMLYTLPIYCVFWLLTFICFGGFEVRRVCAEQIVCILRMFTHDIKHIFKSKK